MIVIPKVLGEDELARVRRTAAEAGFVAGRATADGPAAEAKDNLQLADEEAEREIGRLVLEALHRQPLFHAYAVPARVRFPMVSLYREGMRYGDHVDAPIMGSGEATRTRNDLSLTLFLSPPDSYQGGELVVRGAAGEQRVKLPAGSAVLYRSQHRHRVNPVTAGERLAAVTWVQSHVRDAEEREILFDMSRAMGEAARAKVPEGLQLELRAVYARLMQRWCEA